MVMTKNANKIHIIINKKFKIAGLILLRKEGIIRKMVT